MSSGSARPIKDHAQPGDADGDGGWEKSKRWERAQWQRRGWERAALPPRASALRGPGADAPPADGPIRDASLEEARGDCGLDWRRIMVRAVPHDALELFYQRKRLPATRCAGDLQVGDTPSDGYALP